MAEYVITFSDVMAGVITVIIGILSFLIKGWFKSLQENTEHIRNQINENDKKVNERIEKLEIKTNSEVENIKREINDIKGDFATTFVLREDFFRSMNGVEDKMRSIDNKMDKLLMMKNE